MKTSANREGPSSLSSIANGLAPPLANLFAFLLAIALASTAANAQRRERMGKEIVDTVCASCHVTGASGAPKIGDENAWRKRAEQGLALLSDHALKGIRNMPAHGGSPGVSDIEIERAIVYMVNQSGGHWIEPIGGGTPAVVRTSEQIVQNQCGKCHQTGLGGAPKIGERAEWIPRLKKGLDTLVASAIHGHGQMPARGGLPDLSDQEIRGSIVYMFSYGVAQIPAPAPSLAPAVDPYHKTIAGTEVYLGIVPADAIRATKPKGTPEAVMHGGVPSGRGYYHVNISLVDSKSKVLVTEAEVKVRVADALGGETKSLDLMSASNTISYGNYFRMVARHPYTITAEIRRPGTPGTIEAKFDYKTP